MLPAALNACPVKPYRNMPLMNPILRRAFAHLALGSACSIVPIAHAAAEPAKCTYTAIAKLPLRYSGPSLSITTEGTIHGTPAELLVDTGAFQTLLTRTGTERRGLKLRQTGSYATGIGGTSAIFATNVDEFSVGPVRAGRSNMPVLASFGFTPSYDAILGAPFLLQTDLEVSLATKQLTFFVPENCGDTFLGYWGSSVGVVPLRTHDSENHKNPLFFVRINGKEMEAMIDTGAASSVISSDAARRAGIAFEAQGVKRGSDIVGIGGYTASRWLATVKTFQIGEEVVQNARIAVQDSGMDGADVLLGADFLRSHRVLFAMSQKKLYFSYVGGEPFSQRQKLEPWVKAEAEAGNADAQMVLARAYGNDEQAVSWLEKAAAGGSPYANLEMGRVLVLRRDYAKAVPRLRAALDKLPAERDGALLLYIARVRSGQPELAKSELAATFSRSDRDEWPVPLADFYLGKLSSGDLLAQAADDRSNGKRRRCVALSAMGDWHRAHAQPEQAKALDEQLNATCGDIREDFVAIGD